MATCVAIWDGAACVAKLPSFFSSSALEVFMKSVCQIGLLAVGLVALAGCVQDGKIGQTKIWETPAETTAPKTIWRSEDGSQRTPPSTVCKRADGSSVVEPDERDRRD